MEDKHELEKVEWGVIPIYNYSGTLVTRVYGKGYSVFGQIVSTPDEVDEVIQNACSILSESITVVNKGDIGCTIDKNASNLPHLNHDSTIGRED